MSKITLEDINTWSTLFNFDIPIELDLSEDGEFELFDWDNDDVLKPKFNHDNSYFTIADDSAVFNNNGNIVLENYNRVNPFYLFPTIEPITDLNPKLFYFNPVSNINRLLFENDDLLNRKCYINFLGNEQRPVNNNTPYVDENGWYVPLSVVLDDEIKCDVASSKIFIPKIDYVYAPPLIKTVGELYKGNINNIFSNIDCPVDYKVYYNNQEVKSDFNIPISESKTYYRFKVVTKSEYPYIPFETYVEIPVTVKYLDTISDLDNYSYIEMDRDNSFTLEEKVLAGNCIVKGNNFKMNRPLLVIDGDITFKDIEFKYCSFLINGTASFENCTFKNTENIDYTFINNGNLTFNNSTFENNGYIINNNILSINSTIFNMQNKVSDLPLIHNTNQINLNNNTFNYFNDYTGNNICIIRSNDLNTDELLSNNTFNFDCNVLIDNVNYTVTGAGLTHSNIDEDTIYFKNLGVEMNV